MLREPDKVSKATRVPVSTIDETADVSVFAARLKAILQLQGNDVSVRGHVDDLSTPDLFAVLSRDHGFDLDLELGETVLLMTLGGKLDVGQYGQWQSTDDTLPVTLSLLPAGQRVRLSHDGQGECLWLCPSSAWLQGLAQRANGHGMLMGQLVAGLFHPEFVGLANALRHHILTPTELSPLFADCHTLSVVLHMLDNLARGHGRGAPQGARLEERIAKSVAFVDAHLGEAISVQDMAAQASMSTYHFARSFKDINGMSPHRYVMIRRIERAKMMLCKGSLSIAEIAYQCGFSSQSHLTSAFKKHTGYTPLRYRQVEL